MDDTVHPFAISVGGGDVRITTRWDESYFPMGLYGAMHECGHGLYEDGIAPALQRSPLGRARSLGLHESQSRMWENMVGRGAPFCRGPRAARSRSLGWPASEVDARRPVPRRQPRQPVADPGRGRRGHLLAARRPAVRARAGADRRDALGRRPARGLERPRQGVPRHRCPRTTPTAYCRMSTGRRADRLLPDLRARQPDRRTAVGAGERLDLPELDERIAEGTSRRCELGCGSTSTVTARSSPPQSCSSARPGADPSRRVHRAISRRKLRGRLRSSEHRPLASKETPTRRGQTG